MDRRQFLKSGIAVAAFGLLPWTANANQNVMLNLARKAKLRGIEIQTIEIMDACSEIDSVYFSSHDSPSYLFNIPLHDYPNIPSLEQHVKEMLDYVENAAPIDRTKVITIVKFKNKAGVFASRSYPILKDRAIRSWRHIPTGI